MTSYQMRTLLCDEKDFSPPVFATVGDKETGIITASEFKAIHEAEQRQANEKFVDNLMRRIDERRAR